MKRRPRPGTRRRRLQKNMRSPMRRNRRLRNRYHRQLRAELYGAMIETFQADDRLIAPAWLHMAPGSLVVNPKDLIKVTAS